MPISAANRRRYPADWPAVRGRIRDRAGDRCEWCGVPNHAVGYRDRDGSFVPCGVNPVGTRMPSGRRVFVLVCTVAHVADERPENCDPDNLAFLCQRCHLNHDRGRRAYQTLGGRTDG